MIEVFEGVGVGLARGGGGCGRGGGRAAPGRRRATSAARRGAGGLRRPPHAGEDGPGGLEDGRRGLMRSGVMSSTETVSTTRPNQSCSTSTTRWPGPAKPGAGDRDDLPRRLITPQIQAGMGMPLGPMPMISRTWISMPYAPRRSGTCRRRWRRSDPGRPRRCWVRHGAPQSSQMWVAGTMGPRRVWGTNPPSAAGLHDGLDVIPARGAAPAGRHRLLQLEAGGGTVIARPWCRPRRRGPGASAPRRRPRGPDGRWGRPRTRAGVCRPSAARLRTGTPRTRLLPQAVEGADDQRKDWNHHRRSPSSRSREAPTA